MDRLLGSYLERKLILLLVREGKPLANHVSQVLLHEAHGLGKPLLHLIFGSSAAVVAGRDRGGAKRGGFQEGVPSCQGSRFTPPHTHPPAPGPYFIFPSLPNSCHQDTHLSRLSCLFSVLPPERIDNVLVC